MAVRGSGEFFLKNNLLKIFNCDFTASSRRPMVERYTDIFPTRKNVCW
jgi:hypothetical protein